MSELLEDDGCHLHPHCLSCPRALCYLDEPQPLVRRVQRPVVIDPAREARNARIRQLIAEGRQTKDVAAMFNLSCKTVWAITRDGATEVGHRRRASTRTAEIAGLVAAGVPQKEVAARYGITIQAVKSAVFRSRHRKEVA